MKITNLIKLINVENNNSKSKTKDIDKNTFKNMINSEKIKNNKSELEELISKVDLQRDKLLKKPTLTEVNKYKKLVSEFLKTANVKDELQRQGFSNYNRKKLTLSIIKEINEKLKNLTEVFLSDNYDAFEIIKATDEIRGLMVDIVT